MGSEESNKTTLSDFFPNVTVTIDEFVRGAVTARESISEATIEIPVYDKKRTVVLGGESYELLDSESNYCPTCVRKMTVEALQFQGPNARLEAYSEQVVEGGQIEKSYHSMVIPKDSMMSFARANGIRDVNSETLKGKILDVFSIYHENGCGPAYKGVAIRSHKK